jgi:hypothetical protein
VGGGGWGLGGRLRGARGALEGGSGGGWGLHSGQPADAASSHLGRRRWGLSRTFLSLSPSFSPPAKPPETPQVSAVISVITAFPALTNLTGLNQITQDDESGTSSKVTGLYEAASRLIHNNTLVGVQKSSTLTTLSAISSSSHAAGRPVEAGDKIVLNWRFRGIGSATCTHDGVSVANAPGGKCVSPLSITAKDFGSEDTRHSVVVTFTDVCGRVRKADFEYTQQGVKTLSPAEVLNDDGSIKIVGGGLRGAIANGAGRVGAGAAGAALAGAAGAAALLLAL